VLLSTRSSSSFSHTLDSREGEFLDSIRKKYEGKKEEEKEERGEVRLRAPGDRGRPPPPRYLFKFS